MIAWINLCFYMLEKLISLVYGVQLCAGIYNKLRQHIYSHCILVEPCFLFHLCLISAPSVFQINLLNYCFAGVFFCNYFGRTYAVM